MNIKKTAAVLAVMAVSGCGIYTFSGSTLPGHLRTVDIPLFVNQTSVPGVAEVLTEQVSRQVLADNQLRVINNRGDATITGRVIAYINQPYTYGATGVRQVDIAQYSVVITVEAEFTDNKKGQPLWKGVVEGIGIYDFKLENEETGKQKAIVDIVKRIMQNSVQSW